MEARRRPRAGAQARRRRARVHAAASTTSPPVCPRSSSRCGALPHESVVLDGEALGVDDDGKPRKFQDTMSGLSDTNAFFFDVLHVEGASMIDEPLRARGRVLESLVPARAQLPSIVTADAAEAEAFAVSAVAAGHEGVMVKSIESPYEAGRRGNGVAQGQAGAYPRPRGARRRMGARASHGLAQQPAPRCPRRRRVFVMVGKTFKGMTDELLRWQTAELQTSSDRRRGATPCTCARNWWSRSPSTACSASTRYPGGVALRFARVRRYRPDKTGCSGRHHRARSGDARRRSLTGRVAVAMATLRFNFGTMGSGKSTMALQIHHNLASRQSVRVAADQAGPRGRPGHQPAGSRRRSHRGGARARSVQACRRSLADPLPGLR